MTIRLGINGFGRIGRNVFRAIRQDDAFAEMQIVAVNDLTQLDTLAHLLKYDSVMGRFDGEVEVSDNGLVVDGNEIAFTRFKDPAEIPWSDQAVDYVIESTGLFTQHELAAGHLKGSVRRVVISAPAKGDVKTIVMGVNEDEYDPNKHTVVSNASCTTNCLAPVAKVIADCFGISRGLMTTIHAYTNDQRLLDFPHSDLRRARAAALSMIPTRTGAAAAVSLVIPALAGKFDGLAVRVPTANVSLVDVVMEVEKETSASEVNQALQESANRYLGYTDEPLVSIDFQGDPHSSYVDGSCTRVLGNSVKIMSWYDNEWRYSNRLLDLIIHMQSQEI